MNIKELLALSIIAEVRSVRSHDRITMKDQIKKQKYVKMRHSYNAGPKHGNKHTSYEAI